MDTKDLRCFRLVYEERSINQAARHLFITPQGLSRIISRLEEELHTLLFERTSSGMIPTKTGDYFTNRVRRFSTVWKISKLRFNRLTKMADLFASASPVAF